jgi:hypothetical protein
LRCWAAALVAATVGQVVLRVVPFAAMADAVRSTHLPVSTPLLAGVGVLGVYGVVYFTVAAALGLPEAMALFRRIRGRIFRRR